MLNGQKNIQYFQTGKLTFFFFSTTRNENFFDKILCTKIEEVHQSGSLIMREFYIFPGYIHSFFENLQKLSITHTNAWWG